jgi:hypothetical protein
MYKSIEVTSVSGSVYVTRLKNDVGEKELIEAITLSNTALTIVDIGLFSKHAVIAPESVVILISSSFDAVAQAESISKLNPGVVVRIVEEFSAYSTEYKLKHDTRNKLTSAGFDYAGLNFQIDSGSRINIIGKIMELQMAPSILSVTWISNTQGIDGNDISHLFTREEFIDFSTQVANYYESIILNK